MTAWGVAAVCGAGGLVAGPLLDSVARRVRRPAAAPVGMPVPAEASASPLHDHGGHCVVEPPVEVPPEDRHEHVLVEAAAVALVTAAACALAALRLGAHPQLAAYCVLGGGLAVVSVTDLRTGLVPRRVVYASAALVGAALFAASAADGLWRPMLDALLGSAVAFGVFGGTWWIAPKALGFGDVRLAALCGGALGWLGFDAIYVGFLASFVVGALMGLALLVARGHRRFPFAPALALGTIFGVLWGGWLGGLWFQAR